MLVDDLFESRSNFGVGDPVIITGNVEYRGKTGDVREIGRDGAFVVVDLYNYGPYSFHASDVSYNDYADSEDELNEFALDDGDDPTEDYPCYDCGSTIFLHHTKSCDLAEPNAKRDLPEKPGTQYWTGEIPKGLAPIPGLAEGSNTKTIKPITPAAKRYHEKHQWLLNGNIPGAAKEHYAMIQKLNQKSVAEGSVDHRALGKHHEEMTDQELRKVGSKLPDSWDGVRFRRKLASHPKYAQALKHYNKSEYHFGKAAKQGVAEQQKVGNMPADKFDDAMARLKKLAGAGPLKTVWDPQKRVYKNVPTAVQPKK